MSHNYHFFYGGTFSNWFAAGFYDPVAQQRFANTEQAFMYYKAWTMGDTETRKLIALATDPGKAKDLGRKVKNFSKELWDEHKMFAMVHVNTMKYTQNWPMAMELVNTENKILVEASPSDTIWGIGLSLSDPDIYDETKWRGQNLLGKALMTVRTKIQPI